MESIERGAFQEALDNCDATIMSQGNDGVLQILRKQLMNIIKDQHINENIRHFVDVHDKVLLAREENFFPEIIIPCYNQGRYLDNALASVPDGVPVTVINDASTDTTADDIVRLSKDYHFKLITNEININQTGSINRAVKESSNNLFIILNADDALVNYAVDTILSTLNGYQSVRMVGGSCYPFSEAYQLEKNRELPSKLPYTPKPQIYYPSDVCYFHHPNDLNMTMSSCSFLRSAWEAAGGFWDFDRRICSFDDRDFQMRVCALFPVAVLQEFLAFYRINSSMGRGRCL